MPVTEPLSISFDTPFDEAIAAATTRGVALPDVYYGLLTGVARQLAFSIAGIAAYDQLQAVRDSLAKAMATGQSFREWKKGVAVEALGLPAHRIENIWRTNLQGNYMRGRWEQFVRNADRRPFLIYNAINDTRVRPSHLAMDGIIRRWDDPLWRVWSPPAGFRCRCSLISLSEAQARSRSGFKPNGTGTGINKQPLLDDGTPAQPDPGWDYNPYDDQLDRLAELAEERGVEPPKPWGEQVTPWQDQRLRYQAKLLDTTVDALETKLQADIEAGMQRQSVWISGTRGMVEDLIKDGAIPQVGSSTSANLAELQAMLRFDFEQKVLGEAIGRTAEGITYGHLSELQYGTIRKSVTLGDVSIKLLPSVAARTRVAAAADIFNLAPENGVIPSPMLKPSWRSARITARIGGLPDLKNLEEPTTSWSAMISGRVGIDDIDRIVFEATPPQALQNQLNRLNIRWEVAPADYDPLGPLDDEIPFHAHSGGIT